MRVFGLKDTLGSVELAKDIGVSNDCPGRCPLCENGAEMDHAVYYRDASGEARVEDVPSLDAAIEMVERLRNDDGASDVRVFREIPIEFHTYYKVVAVEQQAVGGPLPPPGAMPLVPPVTVHAEPPLEPAKDDSTGNEHRRPLFNRA